jgi:uncharacterized membrane protein
MDITPGQSQSTENVKRPATYGESFKRMFAGMRFQFPNYKHDHPPVIDVNKLADDQLTVGQKVADTVAATVGSWRFIITQSIILLAWLFFNILALGVYHWDPYPFILLNLMLSFQAAYAAPFVMMSQNRQAEKDRLTAQNDYQTDCKGEEEIRFIMEHLDHQDDIILQIVKRLETQHDEIIGHFKRIYPEAMKGIEQELHPVNGADVENNDDVSGNS